MVKTVNSLLLFFLWQKVNIFSLNFEGVIEMHDSIYCRKIFGKFQPVADLLSNFNFFPVIPVRNALVCKVAPRGLTLHSHFKMLITAVLKKISRWDNFRQIRHLYFYQSFLLQYEYYGSYRYRKKNLNNWTFFLVAPVGTKTYLDRLTCLPQQVSRMLDKELAPS